MSRWPMFMASVKRESMWYRSQFDRDLLLHRTPLAAAVLVTVLVVLGGAAALGPGLFGGK